MNPLQAVGSLPPGQPEGDDVQRDMDLVRAILLKIESAADPIELDGLFDGEPGERERDTMERHVRLLVQQGLISGEDLETFDGKDWMQLDLTWQGHDFLDATRDPDVWRQTKDGAAKAGGWTLKMLASIAEGIIKSRIERLILNGEIG